jgi:hypothetical protein
MWTPLSPLPLPHLRCRPLPYQHPSEITSLSILPFSPSPNERHPVLHHGRISSLSLSLSPSPLPSAPPVPQEERRCRQQDHLAIYTPFLSHCWSHLCTPLFATCWAGGALSPVFCAGGLCLTSAQTGNVGRYAPPSFCPLPLGPTPLYARTGVSFAPNSAQTLAHSTTLCPLASHSYTHASRAHR